MSKSNDIAIIGMSCRVAGADSPSKLWELLASSKDVQTEITRFSSAGFYKSTGGQRKGLTNVRHAYFIDEGIDRFDHGFFSIPPLEASAMDPQQRILLEIAYEAIESAGIPLEDMKGTDTAVYTGIFTNDYGTSLLRDLDATPKYHSTGTSNSIAANRLSYFFDLHGASLALDTACSSTMVALHQAVLGLKAKEAGMALVCGANLIINPDMFVHMSELGFLSPSGKCQSFDASGDGYGRGEGVLALLLKPLDQALEHGDPIRAVIRGTRINQDGRTQGITLPSSEAQTKNLEALYKDYDLCPGDVQYLEAHGTGTAVGDPLELSAIESMFAESHKAHKLVVGSIKSNIGHLEACAALAGIIKTVECLERGQITPQMHFVNPNPKINFQTMTIPTTTMSWPPIGDGVRRAAVNSFGFGGTNGHVVLDHFRAKSGSLEPVDRPFLFKVSAANESSLEALSTSYADYVESRKPSLVNLSHTLLVRRSTLKKSLFCTASNHKELVEKLRTWKGGSSKALTRRALSSSTIGFVFTGQSAQWAEMGKQLVETSKLFEAIIGECDRVLMTLPEKPAWNIREEMLKPPKVSRINISSFSQPICTALQIGLVELWKSWGVTPHAVVGHSSGEIGAAYAAGLLSLRDAMIIAFHRGLHMGSDSKKISPGLKGAMCAVGIAESECKEILDSYCGRIALAAVNSPSSCTLSGDEDAIKEIVTSCKEEGIFCRALRVDMAYHSHHMLPLAPRYEQSMRVAGIAPLASSVDSACEMFSSVTQNKLSPSECSPEYWGKNMTSTVRFTAALTEAVRCHDLGAIVEIGPHPALKGPAMDTLAALGKTEVSYFASCFRGKPDLVSLLDTVGEMINAGLPVVCSNVNGLDTISGLDVQHETGQVLTDLPKYHWDHSVSHWAETRVSQNQRFREFPRHQLLGARCSNDNSLSMSWRNLLMLKEIEWLEEMITARATHFPASAFILMALEATRQLQTIEDVQTASTRLTDILFLEELPLSTLASEDAVIETLFNLRRVEKTEEYTFEVSATTFQPGSDWTKYCSGRINFAAGKTDRRTWEEKSVIHNAAQLDYIESFKIFPQLKLDTLRLNGDRANGRFTDSSDDDEHYHLSPVLFASLTQIPHMLLLGSGLPAAYRLESIDCLEVPMGAWKFHNGDFNVDLTRLGPTRGKTDVQIYDTSGNYMYFRGMRSKLHQLIHRKPPLQSLFYEPQLRPDITYLKSSSPLPVSHIIELVTHKWPMSDIGIIDLSSNDSDTIHSQLQGIKEHERPRFRSLNVVSDDSISDSGRVRTVKSFGTDQKLHLLFSSAQTLHSSASHVRQTGVACIRIQNSHDRALFDLSFDLICEVEGFQSSGWLLGRPKALENGVLPPQRLRVFASQAIDISTLREYGDFEYTQLDKQTIHTICNEQPQLQESFDLIVMDCEKESMLVTWAGNDLLPWIQSVLERVGNLLWVSIQTSASPFSNVAGSFVRTIQSEHPSMRATSLVFKDTVDLQFFNKSIFDVYHDMVHGSGEVELIAKSLQVCALRYQPDDELSASVGLIGPHTSGKSLSLSSYEVALAAQGRAVLLSHRFDSTGTPVCGNVYVAIEASVVDHFDAVLFTDAHSGQHLWRDLGQFFAGRVVSDGDPMFTPNTFVVGWHVGAHKSKVHVSTLQLHSVSESISSAEAAAHYAAFSIAFAVVHEAARARRSEVLSIRLSGLLAEALTVVCHSLGVVPDLDSRKEGDFVVTCDNFHGLLLNGQNVSVEKFMLSDLQQGYMSKYVAEDLPLRSPTFAFALGDFQKAFQNAKMNPISTVIMHTGLGGIHGGMVGYKSPERLFREDAAYVILGGLGGLGRYISTWMVANGAKHLVTLSRSGLTSEDARHTVKTIQDLGAQIQVFQADAGDAKAVDEALAEVRKVRCIRGCLNMVMVLDNSPFMTMKPTQWDRALRTKVDSTWNMHQATLRDDLDIFIMFSSISSISGNRTQANYATGNAFQNAMAEYRKSLGLPGIAIALGAMSGIGVLANDHDLLRTLSQSGLQHLGPQDLTKIMEAAVFESQHPDRSLLSVGFEMFETLDDKVQSKPEQNQLFWTESPEFGFLLDHKFSTTAALKTKSIREKLQIQEGEAAHHTVLQAFLLCLRNVLGYDVATFDPASPLASYGLDSLNAVSCRYWFFKQLEIDVPVFDILGCRSINELVSRVLQRLRAQSAPEKAVDVPQPVHYNEQSLHVRPISHSQSRLWFLNEFLPDKTVYNLLLVCHISGTVKVPLFAKAWSVFIQRHEVLHSKIVDTVDGLQQIPIRNAFFPLTEVEASEMTFQSQLETITEAAKAYKFNLGTGELVHGWLLKSPIGWRFFLASHHLAWDRTSVPTIFDETTAIYRALVNGENAEATLSPVPYQFIDYTLWQEKWLNKQHIVQPLVDYWKIQLAGTPEAVSLFPTALTAKRPIIKQYAVDSMPLHLESSLTSALKAFCKTSAVTPFMFLASAVSALVHRLTGDDDIVIGIADGDRGHTEFDRLVGFTVNMLAIRSKISKDMPYINLLEDYRKVCLEAYEHRAIPFDFLLQQLEVPRRTSHSPIFQITVNYQMQGSFPECDYGDFKFTQYDHYNARSQSDFRLDIEETAAGELHCVFDFDTALYDKTAILSLANTFKVFIENILATKGLARVDSINLIPTGDQEFISSILQPSFGNEPSFKELDRSLFTVLFSNAVAASPTKPALIDDVRCLTYGELSIATNRVANFLISQGARIGDRIGICCEQGIDMIIAMYGIVEAGCVYVPIDPDFPEERMLSMIEDVELETVLVDSFSDKVYERLITCGITVSRIHTINVLATTNGDARPPNLSRELDNSDAFCCIFTSGSTGRPKGIYLGHRQLRYQMEGYHNCIDTVSEDRILLSSAMVFDMSLTAIFGTILHGATMLIASREARYSPAIMVDQLVERQISNCTFTTTQLKILLTAPNKSKLFKWTSLRSMVVGGEQIPPWVVRDFYNLGLPHACVFNGYAPSETTVCNSLRKLLPEDAKRQDIPLERPLFPTRFYILDESFNPVPIGMPGELYIGGPTVNRGYVKREEITAKAFLRDPFASVAEIEDGNGKLYRSGDSFRLMRDGTIQALGRIGGDRQVKIRGMRTELDEIENAIWDACQAVEDPKECPVSLVAVAYYKTGDVDGVLAAYLATTEVAKGNTAQRRSLKAYILLRLKATLPVHMIPSCFVFMSNLPRTVTGKTDYKTILTWSTPVPDVGTVNGDSFQGIQLNKLQSIVASIWKKVLYIDGDLTPWDEFFALGGHSLILLHVQAEIKEQCYVTLSLGDMFANPTIQGMESLILTHPDYQSVTNRHMNEINCTSVNGSSTSRDQTSKLQATSASRQVSALASDLMKETLMDWEKEGSLPEEFDWFCDATSFRPASVIAITGACTMAGAHFLHHILLTTNINVYCIGTEASDDEEARSHVLSTLKLWRLFEDIPSAAYNRMEVYRGSLSHPTLGLTRDQVSKLDREVNAIYQLDSEVSLLKRYENLRASNVGSLQFLISLAHGNVSNTKAIHYLSTWGVPHLQAWNQTELTSPHWLTGEVEMTNMKPGADGTLGYLKCRWACESMLYQAARRGIPVTVFRSCMCAGSPGSGVALARTDINRRILEGSLQTGLVPDFGSERGGGMSWITADFLVKSILFLSQRYAGPRGQAKIYHVVSDTHVPYKELARLLDVSHEGEKLRVVRPEEWFEALRAKGDPEMTMQAEVLEKWCEAGWVPFGMEAKETLQLLKKEAGLVPPKLERGMLLKLAVGERGF